MIRKETSYELTIPLKINTFKEILNIKPDQFDGNADISDRTFTKVGRYLAQYDVKDFYMPNLYETVSPDPKWIREEDIMDWEKDTHCRQGSVGKSEDYMYGAILGDIIGSPFEFDRGGKTKDFDLFTRGCTFTDDSVMTIAIADALLEAGKDAGTEEIEEAVIAHMQAWGKAYPYAGYGGSFGHWLEDKNPRPYGSYGNGSAMRVSSAGWLYDSLERTREVARATAEVTHNHPEGVKGAEATASCIFMARKGASKDEIKSYIEQEFHYDLDRTLAEIRPHYHHVESCQKTVPEAIIAFMEAVSFEDTIRNAVSLGGDTDTLGAIAGSIAEAFYGVSLLLRSECKSRLPKDMKNVLERFDQTLKRAEGDLENYDEMNRV